MRDVRTVFGVLGRAGGSGGSGVLGRVLRWSPLTLLPALVLVIAGITSTGDGPTPSVIYGQLKSQDVRLSMPPTDSPKGIAIYFHGQNGGVDNRMDDPWLQTLVHSGWIVASSNFHTNSWGNEKSTVDTEELLDWARQKTGGVPVRMYISGSMGSTVALNAITHGVPSAPCFYGVKPAIDITKMHNVPGADRIIADAFDGSPPTDRNPINTMAELPTTTRYRFVTSPDDTWVKETQNTDPLVAELQSRGAQVSVLQVHGPHDDPSHFDTADLMEFAAGCAIGATQSSTGTTSAAHAAASS